MSVASSASTQNQLDPNRWRALMVIAIAQLMVVLDASIVNIALPSLQADLGITDANRQWVVTGYTLAFGGLLLLGGRISDFWGRKKAFMLGANDYLIKPFEVEQLMDVIGIHLARTTAANQRAVGQVNSDFFLE